MTKYKHRSQEQTEWEDRHIRGLAQVSTQYCEHCTNSKKLDILQTLNTCYCLKAIGTTLTGYIWIIGFHTVKLYIERTLWLCCQSSHRVLFPWSRLLTALTSCTLSYHRIEQPYIFKVWVKPQCCVEKCCPREVSDLSRGKLLVSKETSFRGNDPHFDRSCRTLSNSNVIETTQEHWGASVHAGFSLCEFFVVVVKIYFF